jgi:hypothetical protein
MEQQFGYPLVKIANFLWLWIFAHLVIAGKVGSLVVDIWSLIRF